MKETSFRLTLQSGIYIYLIKETRARRKRNEYLSNEVVSLQVLFFFSLKRLENHGSKRQNL